MNSNSKDSQQRNRIPKKTDAVEEKELIKPYKFERLKTDLNYYEHPIFQKVYENFEKFTEYINKDEKSLCDNLNKNIMFKFVHKPKDKLKIMEFYYNDHHDNINIKLFFHITMTGQTIPTNLKQHRWHVTIDKIIYNNKIFYFDGTKLYRNENNNFSCIDGLSNKIFELSRDSLIFLEGNFVLYSLKDHIPKDYIDKLIKIMHDTSKCFLHYVKEFVNDYYPPNNYNTPYSVDLDNNYLNEFKSLISLISSDTNIIDDFNTFNRLYGHYDVYKERLEELKEKKALLEGLKKEKEGSINIELISLEREIPSLTSILSQKEKELENKNGYGFFKLYKDIEIEKDKKNVAEDYKILSSEKRHDARENNTLNNILYIIKMFINNEFKFKDCDNVHIPIINHDFKIFNRLERKTIERVREERERESSDRERVQTERDRVQTERVQTETERDRVQTERERVQTERVQTETERDRVQTETERVQTERERGRERERERGR